MNNAYLNTQRALFEAWEKTLPMMTNEDCRYHIKDRDFAFKVWQAALAAQVPVQGEPVAGSVPKFFKGERLAIQNEHGGIYRAQVSRVEVRWSADRKPYVYYHVKCSGDKSSHIITQSQIIREAAIDAARKAVPNESR